MKPLELDALQINQILKQNNPPAPLHTVVDDRRMKPFMSMEDFEKKWAIQADKIEESLTIDEENLEEYTDDTKKKKGIPLNAKSGANGWWYVGTTPVGKMVKGKFMPMVKIMAAKKKADMMKKKKIAALKKKKIAMLKKKKALIAKKKKAALLKKKKTIKKTNSKSTNVTKSSISDTATPIQQYNYYKKVYDRLKKAKDILKPKNTSIFSSGVSQFSASQIEKLTGINQKDLLGLSEYLKKHSYGYDSPLVYNKKTKKFKVYPYDFYGINKPRKDIAGDILTKINATDGGDIDVYFGETQMRKYLKDKKIVTKVSLAQVDKEAKIHGEFIRKAKDQIQDAISDWMGDSVWSYSPQHRKEIFKHVTNIINHHKPRIKKAKQVFRGVSFYPKKSGFFKKYLSQFKVGKVVKLPPAGYSVDPNVASGFAVEEEVKILLRAKSNDNKGIKGISVWESGNGFKSEREIITSGGNYKVEKVTYHNLTETGGKFIFIDLIQINDMNENQELDMNTDDMEVINGIMFGDSMRNTAKNMKKLSGQPIAKKKVTEKSTDTYSIDQTPSEN